MMLDSEILTYTDVTGVRTGPYDALYSASPDFLWNQPGRLVQRIDEWIPPASSVLDVGCGDGKNALPLVAAGYSVTGFDISTVALKMLRRRFAAAGIDSSSFRVATAEDWVADLQAVDCLLSYGLFHCLPPSLRGGIHARLQRAVRPGGITIFSCLLDGIALPESHHTPGLTLAGRTEVAALFEAWDILEWHIGTIREQHPPLVGDHSHESIWCVARKPE